MFGIGGSEIAVIALIALLLFGPSRLPGLARSLAKAYREFQKFRRQMDDAVAELRSDIEFDDEDTAAKPSTPKIRPPSGDRVSSSGEDYLAEQEAAELIELDVPDEDDYLAPGRSSGEEA